MVELAGPLPSPFVDDTEEDSFDDPDAVRQAPKSGRGFLCGTLLLDVEVDMTV
jgi:hypothetical protein